MQGPTANQNPILSPTINQWPFSQYLYLVQEATQLTSLSCMRGNSTNIFILYRRQLNQHLYLVWEATQLISLSCIGSNSTNVFHQVYKAMLQDMDRENQLSLGQRFIFSHKYLYIYGWNTSMHHKTWHCGDYILLPLAKVSMSID